jgi:prepilin-type N-terminal cleavage/methylation domain-containing protein
MKKGFSLIELLVVVAIIGILTGITMRLWSNASQKAAYAQAVTTLELVDHWLEEYYSLYSYYPSTQNFLWEDPNSGNKPPDWSFITGANSNINTGLPTGLCYWFENYRDGRLMEYYHNIPQNRGERDHTESSIDFGFEYGIFTWTNGTHNLIDPWGREYYYTVDPSLQSYETYSSGPDGIVGSGDDVSYEAWTE